MSAVVPRAVPRHWVYLDDQRTHEVHAQYSSTGPQGLLLTTEFPMGSREPGEMVQAQTPVRGEAELLTLLGELEQRLVLGGRYYRSEAGNVQWTPVTAARVDVDLRAHEAPIPGMETIGGRMRFHHFHGETGRDKLVISMPRPGMEGRHVLAQMDFDFPSIETGEMSVLHTRLATPLLASAVAKEHIEAPRRGFRKLFGSRDYERAYGEGWFEQTKAMLSHAAARLIGGQPPAPTPVATPVAMPSKIERMRAALATSRVEALKLRFIDPVTEAVLVEGGEHGIRRYIHKLRMRTSHQESYDVSMLEAILLTEYALPAKMWDLAHDEGGKLLRYLYGYDS